MCIWDTKLTEKVEEVKNAPEPKYMTELKSYLGLLTYILLSVSSTHGNRAGIIIQAATVKDPMEMDTEEENVL